MNKVRVKIDGNDCAMQPGITNREERNRFGQLKRLRAVHHSQTFLLPEAFVPDGQREGDLAEIEAMVKRNAYGNGE